MSNGGQGIKAPVMSKPSLCSRHLVPSIFFYILAVFFALGILCSICINSVFSQLFKLHENLLSHFSKTVK